MPLDHYIDRLFVKIKNMLALKHQIALCVNRIKRANLSPLYYPNRQPRLKQ